MAKVGCCWKSECNVKTKKKKPKKTKKPKKPELLSIVGEAAAHSNSRVWSGLLDQSAGVNKYKLIECWSSFRVLCGWNGIKMLAL